MRQAVLFLVLAMSPSAALAQATSSAKPGFDILGSGHFAGYEELHFPGWTGDAVAPGGARGTRREDVVYGGAFGVGVVARVGRVKNAPVLLEWNGAVITGSGAVSSTQTYNGKDALLLTGGSAPTSGTISLTTGSGTASGTVSITDSAGDSATIVSSASSPPGPNSIAQYAVSTTAKGAAFLALTTDGTGPAGSGYAFVADNNGYALIGVGDLNGSRVTLSTDQVVLMTTQRLMFSMPIQVGKGWSITPKIGPNYDLILRSVRHQTRVDIDEGPGTNHTIPDIGITHRDNLSGHYFGGLAGASISGPLGERFRFSLGLEAGLAAYWMNYAGSSSAVLPGLGSVELPGDNQSASGLTFSSRLTGGLSYQTPAGFTVGIGGHIDRLEDVPFLTTTTLNAPNASFAGTGSSASYTGSGETYYQKTLATAPMWRAGVSLSISGRF